MKSNKENAIVDIEPLIKVLSKIIATSKGTN